MNLLLRFVDFLLRLRSPEPPPIAEPAWEPDVQRLSQLYLELGNEMRALRATEGTTIAAFSAFSALIFAGGTTLLANEHLTPQVQQVTIAGSVLVLLVFWLMVHARIAHDHASFEHLMSRRRWIERRWFWPGMPGSPLNAAKGRAGPGYRKSQALVAFAALSVAAVLSAGLVLASVCPKTDDPPREPGPWAQALCRR